MNSDVKLVYSKVVCSNKLLGQIELLHFSKQELYFELQMASYKLVFKPDAFWVLLTIEGLDNTFLLDKLVLDF